MSTVEGVVLLALVLFSGCEATAMEIRREKRSDDVSALQTVVAGLSQQMTAFNAKLTAMQAKLDAANINVAFHAHHSSDPFNVASQGTIVYNVVTTNISNAYNRNSGYFTAPVSGTYVFFTNCMAVDSMGEEMYIKQDGKSGIVVCYSSHTPGSLTSKALLLSPRTC